MLCNCGEQAVALYVLVLARRLAIQVGELCGGSVVEVSELEVVVRCRCENRR